MIDTPGLHKPRTLLGSRLNDVVRETWAEVDVIGFCVPADEPVGRGDAFIVDELKSVAGRTPVLGVVTKTDLVRPEQVAERLGQLAELMEFAEIVPCSAVDGFQVRLLADLLVARLPEGPPLYPDGELTDEPEETLVAELIREAALEGVRDELPHSIAVIVDEMVPHEGRDNLLDVHAVIYVERSSQKGIVIGKGGARLRAGRHGRAPADRGAAGHQGLPRPAREGRQGLAARPEAAAQAGLLAQRHQLATAAKPLTRRPR